MKKISNLKIKILSDNFVSTVVPPLLGEWGFSALIEADDVKILYDVGNSGYPVLYNSEKMGIDLTKVDYVVLSHGHVDHTGGLGNSELVKKLEGKIVVAHPSIFEKKLMKWSNKLEYIGIPMTMDEMEKHFHLILTSKPLQITEGIVFSGEIKRYGFNEYTKGLYTARDFSLVDDHMIDDTALFLSTENGLVVLTGCGHSGILNILNYAKESLGENVYAALGGFHLLFSPRNEVENVSKELLKLEKIGPAHCSGNTIKSIIAEGKDKFIDSGVGQIITF